MKILVLSDSHSALSFMFRCAEVIKPDAIVHLGDYYDDGVALAEDYPNTPFYRVPGNCDRYRHLPTEPEILIQRIGGVNCYMTHGHRHNVKLTEGLLLRDARAAKVDIVLYGHTHEAECRQEADGMWVMNPGSCGYYGGSAGLITIQNGKIVNCRILRHTDLEEML